MRVWRPSRNPRQLAVRFLAPDLLRGLALVLLVLTNVPLILTTIRYRQGAGVDPFEGDFWNDIAISAFLAVPVMTGMGMFVLAMGNGLLTASASTSAFHHAQIRLIVLGTVGLLHGLILWWGDILFYYMVAGLVALYFRGWSARSQVILGAIICLSPLVLTTSDFFAQLWGVRSSLRDKILGLSAHYESLQSAAASAYVSGDVSLVSAQRATDWFSYFQDFALVGIPQLVGLLLIGIGIARQRELVRSLVTNSTLVRTMFRSALGIAFIGYAVQISVQIFMPTSTGLAASLASNLQLISAPTLAVSLYIWFITCEAQMSRHLVVVWFANSGRYALSIYLATSIICTFAAYGMGLFNSVSFLLLEVIAVVLLAVLTSWANVMKKLHVRGPAEWLLRQASARLAGAMTKRTWR